MVMAAVNDLVDAFSQMNISCLEQLRPLACSVRGGIKCPL